MMVVINASKGTTKKRHIVSESAFCDQRVFDKWEWIKVFALGGLPWINQSDGECVLIMSLSLRSNGSRDEYKPELKKVER